MDNSNHSNFRVISINIMVKVILVTGGRGLIGNGIKTAIKSEKLEDEEWIFVGSKDADLT